jgi:hypothetical protein
MKHTRSIALVLTGIMLGCGAAAVAPMATTSAYPDEEGWSGANDGAWSCYAVDRFPDVDDARSWERAATIAQGLNRVATHVPKGTIVTMTPKTSPQGSYASIACVVN